MKILFVRTRPLSSNTSSSLRAIATVKMLIATGATVTVLCADLPAKEDDIKIDFNDAVKFVKIKPSGMYTGVTASNNKGNKNSFKKTVRATLRRIYSGLNVIDPLKCVVKQVGTVRNGLDAYYDAIISCSDPKSSHLLANEVIKQGIKCGRYIQIWGDPLALDITRKFYYPHFIIKRVEHSILRPCTGVYYVSPMTCEEEKKEFPDYANKMNVLLPTYQQEVIYTPVKGVHSVGYFGDYFSESRDILPFYHAVRKLGLKAIICGNSDINVESTEEIEVHPRVSKESIDKYQEEVDLLVCIGNSHGTQIPGKIYQYAATNKPILLISDGSIDFKSLYGRYNRFIFAKNNENSIIAALEEAELGSFNGTKPLYEFSSEARMKDIMRMIGYEVQ